MTTISLNLFNTFHINLFTTLLHFLQGADMSIRQKRVGVRRPEFFDNCILNHGNAGVMPRPPERTCAPVVGLAGSGPTFHGKAGVRELKVQPTLVDFAER